MKRFKDKPSRGGISPVNAMKDLRVGARVQIRDNGWMVTHITPRWSYRYHGTIVRLNDQSVTIELDDFDHERIRVNYEDVYVLGRADDVVD